jgi:hypothetical protein
MPDHCACRQVAGDVGEARTKGFGGLCRFPAAFEIQFIVYCDLYSYRILHVSNSQLNPLV